MVQMAFCDLSHTYHKQVTNVSPACFCDPTVENLDVSFKINIFFFFFGNIFIILTFLQTLVSQLQIRVNLLNIIKVGIVDVLKSHEKHFEGKLL